MKQRHMPMGYKMIDGMIEIEKEQAEIVRMIFREYVGGKSLLAIAKELTAKKILNANKKPIWNHVSVGRILHNVKYQGNAFYPSIIDENTFKQAQEQRDNRKIELGRTKQVFAIRNQSIFVGKVRCGECGEEYKKYVEHAGKPFEKVKWKCKNYIFQNRVWCRNLFFTEDELKNIVLNAVNQLIKQKRMLQKIQPIEPPKMSLALLQTEDRIKELEQEGQFSSPELAELIFRRATLYYAGSKIEDYKSKTEKIRESIADLESLTEFDDELFETIVDHMTVHQDASVEIEFINGIIINEHFKYRRKDEKDGSSKKDGSNHTTSNEI